MIRLVVWDWNGTLLADTTAIIEGGSLELAVLGRPPITLKQFREHYDVPLSRYFQNLGVTTEELAANRPAMTKAFHDFYEPRVAKAHTRPGARAVLSHLRTKGIPMVILSNHTLEGIYLQLERLKLRDYFAGILANEAVGMAHHQGKQQRLEDYLKAHKLPASEAVIIGDTIEEPHIAHNLGMKSVALTGGHCSRQRLVAAKPDVLISSLHDLIEVIEEWNRE